MYIHVGRGIFGPTNKMTSSVSRELIERVVKELVDPDALEIVFYLQGKHRISEFIIAEELDLEIHRTRNLLYQLLEHNIVSFLRKKDKIKGWYICYWDFNDHVIPFLIRKIRSNKISKLEERLSQEDGGQFYMCRNACARMDFEKAIEFNFKCPECGEIMNLQDNVRTIEFLKNRLQELMGEQDKEDAQLRKQEEALQKLREEEAAKIAAEKAQKEADILERKEAIAERKRKAAIKKAAKDAAKKATSKKPITKKTTKKATTKTTAKKTTKKSTPKKTSNVTKKAPVKKTTKKSTPKKTTKKVVKKSAPKKSAKHHGLKGLVDRIRHK